MPAEFWGGVSIICVLAVIVLAWIVVAFFNRNSNAFRFRRDCLTREERAALTDVMNKRRKEQREANLKYINDCIAMDSGKGWNLLRDDEVQEVRDAFAASMSRRYDW